MSWQISRESVAGLLALAGFQVLRQEELIDGYGYNSASPHFFQHPPRCSWWFVKTEHGWIKLGWRKRVIEIEWEDTGFNNNPPITEDKTTQDAYLIHAWSMPDALRYLTLLKSRLKAGS